MKSLLTFTCLPNRHAGIGNSTINYQTPPFYDSFQIMFLLFQMGIVLINMSKLKFRMKSKASTLDPIHVALSDAALREPQP